MKLQTLILQIPIKLLAPVAQQLIFITGQLGIYAVAVKKISKTMKNYSDKIILHPVRTYGTANAKSMSKTRITQTKRAYKKL